ncbi:three-Cys-motif partner protein TcmP [Mycobacterium sp. CBMA293]|uniref:three-Cys-motif partner protein TcmP n=1 Tax=unclassified Mycolicibacterium TaxID=2636767 RepID=UPI0012DE9C74|nr:MULTISPECIES: three-Cys-motif partner protein TcmP [unclassified Mycolicibacterium]MUL47629.1 three-Cys-motif partner protein TcmP [Mycolicibacterium sp. CBMA 360]MUL61853.1 three-Cys-motif partner protein TcmP [Mycolicibacterium sp. CBMA 335]MUL68926.1 three-Cys-motif partner protein TcmP [Mycolicibacterium sp. CBMA 311]MUL92857.1 three-Cys-motif partner protein TcmP [Mycolicibacterium sp. CBMA 230]MUM14321.1 three-Cys-motif partner protein TcmP [Mycolicibacterium sp. CBMA 293]
MATGANAKYWKDARLPGVLKHNLLKRYLPVFLIRTASVARCAAYFDGFAGRGIYDNGQLGSAGQMLDFAVGQKFGSGVPISLHLCEKKRETYLVLDELCDKYRAKGIDVDTSRDDAKNYLRNRLPYFADRPAFIFLDPCGVGIPFDDLVAAANRGGAKHWPPTEVMINFSLEALRRIGGHVTSATPSEATMKNLDVALGGDWWRAYFAKGVTDEAVDAVVKDFAQRLLDATKMSLMVVPVRRAPTHKPIYHLIYGTRHPAGMWNFSHATAKAIEDWWAGVSAQQEKQQGPGLFDAAPNIKDVEKAAVPVIADNIRRLVEAKGTVRLGDYPVQVFGDYVGQVRDLAARAAVKQLYKEGFTSTTGVGGKTEDLKVVPA